MMPVRGLSSPSSEILGLPRWWWWSAGVLVILAVFVRVLLFSRFPIFLTNDSPEYLRAGEILAERLDFTSPQLRDWRAPGYPLFLALLQWLGVTKTAGIVAAQNLGGVVCVVLGLIAGVHLGCRKGALVLGAFLAFNPVYLLFEHMAMSEALFIQQIWIFTTLAIFTLGRKVRSWQGLALGAAFSVCILTRSPGLFFCAPVAFGLLMHAALRGGEPTKWARSRSLGLGLAISMFVVIAPWSYRNHVMYGTWSPFTNNVQRTMLAYLYVNRLVDRDLPEARAARQEADNPRVAAGKLVQQLGTDAEAEQKAAQMVREQISGKKRQYVVQVASSFVNLLGFPSRAVAGTRDISYWYRRFVEHTSVVHGHNQNLMRRLQVFTYSKTSRQGRILGTWSALGQVYLNLGRPILSILFTLLVGAFLYRAGPRFTTREQAAVLLLIVGVGAVAAGHAVLLAGLQRYAVPWDGALVLVILGILASFDSQHPREPDTND